MWGSCEFVLVFERRSESKTSEEGDTPYIRGLEVSLEDIDGMVLGSNIAQVLWTTSISCQLASEQLGIVSSHYFSTQGWTLVSLVGAFDDAPFAAAASLRALRSKKLAMLTGDTWLQGLRVQTGTIA